MSYIWWESLIFEKKEVGFAIVATYFQLFKLPGHLDAAIWSEDHSSFQGGLVVNPVPIAYAEAQEKYNVVAGAPNGRYNSVPSGGGQEGLCVTFEEVASSGIRVYHSG